MDKDIRQRFQQAEDALLDSISIGEASLMSFETSWDSLYADYSRCLSAGELSDETISIANSVASRVVIITNCFSDLHKNTQRINEPIFLMTWRAFCVALIVSAFRLHQYLQHKMHNQRNHPSPSSSKPAYKWLLTNINNPYPSSDTKASIASSSGCPVSSVGAWFISARRRIGWTTICRKHFKNCRADTVDAASHALVKEDYARQMKAATQDLYASTFTKSALAGELDAVVKDMTEEDRLQLEREKKERAREEKKRREEEKEVRRIQRVLDREAQKAHTAFASCPSPRHSLSASPVPTLEESWTDESEDEEDDFIPPVLAGRKRRASVSSESTDPGRSSCPERPMKRLRSNAKVPTPFADTSALPSPPSSSGGVDGRSSRKRRLSDADVHSVPKRPRGLHVGPRVHTASIPLGSNIDNWFQTNFFEIPVLPLLTFEVYNGYTFPDNQINPLNKITSFEAKLVNLEVPSHAPIPAPDLGNLDNFNFFNAMSTIPPDYSGEVVWGPPQQLTLFFQPPVDLVDLVPSDPFSWTDLLNSEQPFLSDINQFSLPSSCDDFSQLLPEIDLSVLQLPPLLYAPPQPQPSSLADSARLAKLEQLQLLREQTRLLEQDLAVSVYVFLFPDGYFVC
ncbi:homeodomain protein 1 [Suillus subalutaceus]|uniref:homeodomain protein 1 n=1 Tax=Suillus subalutaceus TaxID=48586 RepID=UPI001B876CD9|nr:homeodomain protein 1 [Suillus subalutaceus]KAG1864759.1 homeodomain protein 1 [Suillus subalutaceus]